jgi:hypothetical protein
LVLLLLLLLTRLLHCCRAIQLHPTVEGLWIVAAGYEFEYNENITAARGARHFMPLRARVCGVCCVCGTYPRFFFSRVVQH